MAFEQGAEGEFAVVAVGENDHAVAVADEADHVVLATLSVALPDEGVVLHHRGLLHAERREDGFPHELVQRSFSRCSMTNCSRLRPSPE
jgi:hypothetical protein